MHHTGEEPTIDVPPGVLDAYCAGLEEDPRLPAILDNVFAAVDAGDLAAATDTMYAYLRGAANGLIADSLLRTAADTIIADLVAQGPASRLPPARPHHDHRNQSRPRTQMNRR